MNLNTVKKNHLANVAFDRTLTIFPTKLRLIALNGFKKLYEYLEDKSSYFSRGVTPTNI